MGYVCKHCGRKSSSSSFANSSCSKSPTKTHEIFEEDSAGYVCIHCGRKSSSPSFASSSCSKSPTKTHQITKQRSQYVCRHCGRKSSSPSFASSSCSKSPTKTHELIEQMCMMSIKSFFTEYDESIQGFLHAPLFNYVLLLFSQYHFP